MKRIRIWWQEQVFWWRFTHGKCIECGKYKPLTGATTCGLCLSKAIEQWREREYV